MTQQRTNIWLVGAIVGLIVVYGAATGYWLKSQEDTPPCVTTEE